MLQDIESVRAANEYYHELMREGKSFDEIVNESSIDPYNKEPYLNESLDGKGLRRERRKTQRKKNKKR